MLPWSQGRRGLVWPWASRLGSEGNPDTEAWGLQMLQSEHRQRVHGSETSVPDLQLLSIHFVGSVGCTPDVPEVPASFKVEQYCPHDFESFVKSQGCSRQEQAVQYKGTNSLPGFAEIEVPGPRQDTCQKPCSPRGFERTRRGCLERLRQGERLRRQGIMGGKRGKQSLCCLRLTIEGGGKAEEIRRVRNERSLREEVSELLKVVDGLAVLLLLETQFAELKGCYTSYVVFPGGLLDMLKMYEGIVEESITLQGQPNQDLRRSVTLVFRKKQGETFELGHGSVIITVSIEMQTKIVQYGAGGIDLFSV
jgi:hypothetical protein